MDVVSGKRKGTLVYIYDGYTYYRDYRFRHVYRCSLRHSRKCISVLIDNNGQFILRYDHNHPVKAYVKEIKDMKEEMLRMCRETVMPTKEIFDTVCRTNPDAAVHVTYNSLKSMLFREKAKLRPPVPHTINELHEQLRIFEPMKHVYKAYVISEDGSSALIFASNKMLEALALSEEVFVDGTFSVVPKIPKFAQLYSVHIRYADTGVAAAFILCGSRTMALYKAIWKKLLELAPGLQENLKFIMSDYEKAAIAAMRETFPNASIHGCWFHYSQALRRKWRSLNISINCQSVLSMAMVIPLAPKEYFNDAINVIQNIANSMFEEYPLLLLFINYLKKNWLPIAANVSVYNCPVRTNNIVESFHNVAFHKLGSVHPNTWRFLDNVTKLICDQELDYERLQAGNFVRRIRTAFNHKRTMKILNAQKNLINGSLSLEHFLQMFQHMQEKSNTVEKLLNEDTTQTEVKNNQDADDMLDSDCRADTQIDYMQDVSLIVPENNIDITNNVDNDQSGKVSKINNNINVYNQDEQADKVLSICEVKKNNLLTRDVKITLTRLDATKFIHNISEKKDPLNTKCNNIVQIAQKRRDSTSNTTANIHATKRKRQELDSKENQLPSIKTKGTTTENNAIERNSTCIRRNKTNKKTATTVLRL